MLGDIVFCPSDACDLTLDPNTAHKNLKLSADLKEVTKVKEKLPYPDHPDRFVERCHLLCRDALPERSYWEVEWKGMVHVAVTYRGIRRTGNWVYSSLGRKGQSWSLLCSDDGYSLRLNGKERSVSSSSSLFPPPSSSSSSSSVSHRVAVYIDRPAGILSFYKISSGTLIQLKTFRTTFTEPLYAVFGFRTIDSSVTLCSL